MRAETIDATGGPIARPVRRDWGRLASIAGFVALLHVLGWVSLVAFVAPARLSVGGGGVFGIGLGVTAYTLGMRHAFDADHIVAIDNTTRKLMTSGQRPVSVGFWFSLGHSSIVFGLCLLLSLGVRTLAGEVSHGSSGLQQTAGLIGTTVSGAFLLIIGALNLVVLHQIVGVFRGLRQGRFDDMELEQHLANRGLLNRVLRGVTRLVSRPWQMYPVGLLFGLGFDTATEVSLLVLAGGAAAFALPWYAILTLPVLFAAGMSLLDSLDGAFMNYAYGWAFGGPVRKVYYNLAITGLSVAVALGIGGIEIIGLLAERLNLRSGPLAWIAGLNLNYVGFGIVAMFVLTWAVALVLWRWLKLERRWVKADDS